MTLSSIVSVSISAGTSFPSQRGFGTPLLLGFHTRFAENHRLYSSLQGMLSDGFTVDDPMYKMASKAFSQNPRPPQVRIGRLPTPASAHTTTLDVSSIVSGESVSMVVTTAAGVSTTVTQAYDTSANATATALASTIDGIAGLGATASTGVVTVTADANGDVAFFADVTGPVMVRDTTADWGYDTQLGLILNETADFYAVMVDVNSDANIADVAAWALANDRLAFFAPQSTDPADYATQGGALQTAGNDRAVSLVTQKSRAQFHDVGWACEGLPWAPGSQTWMFKTIRGSETDSWSDSDLSAIEAYGGNHYTTVAGLNITRNGVTHGGEYIDVTRGLDWLVSRIQEAIFALLANNRKVPFTDSGGQLIKQSIQAILDTAVTAGVLEGGTDPDTGDSLDPFVTVPRVASLLAADRAARHFTGVEFQGRLAGAVHKVTVVGTVSV